MIVVRRNLRIEKRSQLLQRNLEIIDSPIASPYDKTVEQSPLGSLPHKS